MQSWVPIRGIPRKFLRRTVGPLGTRDCSEVHLSALGCLQVGALVGEWTLLYSVCIEEGKRQIEGKGRRCCFGDRIAPIIYRTSYFPPG